MLQLAEPSLAVAPPSLDITTEGWVSMRFRILFGAAALLTSLGAAAAGVVGTASANEGTAYVCRGGNFAAGHFTHIGSGNYSSITVKGVCNISPYAVINVSGSIHVAAGAVLDAQSAPSTITVAHNVTAASGSLLGMGCQPAATIGTQAGVPCAVHPKGHTTITVGGTITAKDANTVLLRKLTIGGNIRLVGGGGDIPWSIKGNAVGGNVTIKWVTADWLGLQFNTISGNATLKHITVTDPGDPGRTVAVVENTVGQNLNCRALRPGVSPGFIPGEVNHVGGNATGQCAAISE